MSTKKILVLIAIVIFAVLIPIIYAAITMLSTDKNTKVNVIASNGVEFKEIYTTNTFPDESYSIEIQEEKGEVVYLFGGDGSGNPDIQISYIGSNGNLDYYKAIHENREILYESLFVYNPKEKIVIDGSEKYIERFPESIIMFNDTSGDVFELFVPAAKYQILNENNGDYIGAYAERLISYGNDELINKIRFLVDNPEKIKCNICSKEEILIKCNELLLKYGGEQ